jgi:hypothetical protein
MGSRNIDARWWFVACLAARIVLVVAVKLTPSEWLPWAGAVALLPVLGFAALFFGIWERKREVFGQRIWWNAMRPIHTAILLAFAVMAFLRSKWAFVPLAIDVMVGTVAFAVQHVLL